MRLHVGCGSVYLYGYRNVDVKAPGTFLAADRPDLVERWRTTEDDYYAKHKGVTLDTLREGPLDQEYVCDDYGDFASLPSGYWEADEILARHSFEHLSSTEANAALDQMDAVMKTGAVLRLDVPDHEETLRLYKQTGDEFYIRHLLGPRRTDRGFHMMSYTRERLKALCEDHGFWFVAEEPNIHLYPAFCLRFIKGTLPAPRDYVKTPEIPADWWVADVGPGAYPFQRANVFIDRNSGILDSVSTPTPHQSIVSDFDSGLAEIPDKKFDYVWCSHVLEHLDDVESAAKTLSRIGKSGTLVVPSSWKEALFFGEELEHKWNILPSPVDGGAPVFVRNNLAFVGKLRDKEAQSSMCRLMRTGPNRLSEGRYLRKWYRENEASLDVVHHWKDELKLQVIG